MTVNRYSFCRAFEVLERDNFSYEGLNALFDHLEELEEELNCNFELDPIALCCDYTEYENLEELCKNYDLSFEEIKENTDVLDFTTIEDGSIKYIVKNF